MAVIIHRSESESYMSRPHFIVFPHDEAGFSIDDQYFVGSSGLLVKPVTEKGATQANVYLAGEQVRKAFWARVSAPLIFI